MSFLGRNILIIGMCAAFHSSAWAAQKPDPTSATFTSCLPEMKTAVNGWDDCSVEDVKNDVLNTDPTAVNRNPGFFGKEDWEFIEKRDKPGNQGSLPLNYQPSFGQYLVVFKGGEESRIIGYSVKPGKVLDWIKSPLYKADLTAAPYDISHISIYGRGTPIDAPMSASTSFLGLLFGAMALVRRRLRKA